MAVISRAELENAQRDVTDLGKVVNGAADLANPGHPVGTVQTRLGATIKTLAKVAADGTATVESLLTPLVYETDASMQADKSALVSGVLKIKAGQTAYCRQTTQIYILTSVTVGSVTTRTWEQVSDLAQAASASQQELVKRSSVVGRVSVDDYYFLQKFDRFHGKRALDEMFIKWPGKATINQGLALALGDSTWGARFGQEGVDFSIKSSLVSSLLSGNAHPAWTTPNRILLKPDTIKIVDGYNILGIININNAVTEACYIRNSIVDGNYAALTGVQPDGTNPIHIDFCLVRNFTAQGHTLNNGTIQNTLFEGSQGDGMKGDGIYGLIIYNCMTRLLGQQIPTAHADAIQISNCNGLRIYGSTFYMPGSGSTYDEGTYGSTQCLRMVTESNTNAIQNVFVAGNLFIGGGYTVAVRSRFTGSQTFMRNVIIANNMLGGPTYHLFGHITSEHGKATGSNGLIENLLMHNNRDIAGNPMARAGVNQNGLWHFNKATASEEFLDIGKRWGYLDWNGDVKSGISNRTEVNQAVGTIP